VDWNCWLSVSDSVAWDITLIVSSSLWVGRVWMCEIFIVLWRSGNSSMVRAGWGGWDILCWWLACVWPRFGW